MTFFQNVIVAQLCDAINSKAGSNVADANDISTIFNNMKYLAETGKSQDISFEGVKEKEFLFMPKAYKVMLLRLISETASIQTTARWDEDKLTCHSQLYYDREDHNPVASYGKVFSATRLLGAGKKVSSATNDEIAVAEAQARGITETRVLTSFGIGAWLNGETGADPEIQLSELDAKNMREELPVVKPTPIAPDGPKVGGGMPAKGLSGGASSVTNMQDVLKDACEHVEVNTAVTPAAAPVTKTGQMDLSSYFEDAKAPTEKKKTARKTSTEKAPVAPAEAKVKMSPLDARCVKADVGVFNGVTLANVERDKPSGFVYIYKKTANEEVKDAILAIAKDNADLAYLLKASGINV